MSFCDSLMGTQDTQDTQRYSKTLKENQRRKCFAKKDAYDERFIRSAFSEVLSWMQTEREAPQDNDTLFRLIRHVKGESPEEFSGEEAFDAFMEACDDIGGIPDYIERPRVREELVDMWCEMWDTVRYEFGRSPLEIAHRKSKDFPVTTMRSRQRPHPRYDRFVGLAAWLQAAVGCKPIYLPCREVAEVMSTSKNMVSIWRRWASGGR